MPTSFSERIRLQRLQRGLSQENMAELLGLSTTAYGDIERGKTDITLSRLQQIAGVLNLSLATLLGEDSAQPPGPIVRPDLQHENELLHLTVEKQRAELDKLRLEAQYWKHRYEERLAWELARAAQAGQVRERIGF